MSEISSGTTAPHAADGGPERGFIEFSALDVLMPWAERWVLIIAVALGAGLLALGVTFVLTPTFTARTTFLPPQQQQSSAAAALASLGGLAGLAGAAGGMRTPADQYASLMQSVTVADKLVQRFKLTDVYQVSMKTLARQKLEQATRIAVGKKDGLISVEVDDTDPARAADVANAYVEELRQSLSTIAVTEAQQRRAFFEIELKASRDRLTKAQLTLQGSGFNASSLRAEPKAAAEGYAKLKAEVTSAEVRLQTLRSTLVDSTPEVQRQVAQLSALRSQLAKLEQFSDGSSDADYLGKYREFKYQEALFELFARQYEMARLDESREGPLLQVVDKAMPPELRSKPRRAITAVVVTLCTAAILMTLLSIRGYWRQRARNPAVRQKLSQLKAAIRD